MSEIEKKWYVLRAVSGKESKVKEYLDIDIKNSGLSDYVSQVLIPTENRKPSSEFSIAHEYATHCKDVLFKRNPVSHSTH